MKIRIKFSKQGTMKFIGHLDVMRCFQKIMRRAGVNICYSTGFSPHQIMSFASPLGVGLTSDGEYVDIEVHSTGSSEEMLRRINAVSVEGLEATGYYLLPEDAANAMSSVAAADYTVRFREGKAPADTQTFLAAIPAFLSQECVLVVKKSKKGERETDILPLIYRLTGREEEGRPVLSMQIASGSAANVKPELVVSAYLDFLGEKLPDFALLINRDEVYADASGKESVRRLCPLSAFGTFVAEALCEKSSVPEGRRTSGAAI